MNDLLKGDHLHCCPKDHTCEPERGRCRRNINSLKSIICPDGITDCPDGFYSSFVNSEKEICLK